MVLVLRGALVKNAFWERRRRRRMRRRREALGRLAGVTVRVIFDEHQKKQKTTSRSVVSLGTTHLKYQTKKSLILPGIEPGISGSVDPRLIHWATEPVPRWVAKEKRWASRLLSCFGDGAECKLYDPKISRSSDTTKGVRAGVSPFFPTHSKQLCLSSNSALNLPRERRVPHSGARAPHNPLVIIFLHTTHRS